MLKKLKKAFKRKTLVILGTLVAASFLFMLSACTYDMSAITFADQTFTYDGESHSIGISGTLPDGVSVSYDGNDQTEVGVYTVTASFTGESSMYDSITSLTATLTIKEADMTDITFESETYTYDGTFHTLEVSGITDTDRYTVSYSNNSQKAAGEYSAMAIVTDTEGTYETEYLTATLTIEAATSYDIEFTDVYVAYDGEVHSITATNLPTGVTATYSYADDGEVEGETEIGTYTVTASFTDELGNYDLDDMTATLYIQDSELSDISFDDNEVTYDGTVQSLTITGDLPTNISVVYEYDGTEAEGVTDAGTYEVTAIFTVENDLYEIEAMTATLTIDQSDTISDYVNFDDLYFNIVTANSQTSATMTYTLVDQEVALPTGVNATYSDNATESTAGTYTVTVTFSDENGNYADYTATATMTVVIDATATSDYTVEGDSDTLTATISTYKGDDTSVIIPTYVIGTDLVAYRVTAVAASTFSGDTDIVSISFNDNITSIGDSCCYGCTSLTTVSLPDNDEFTEIADNAFYNCALTSIDIPSSVDTVGTYAFYSDDFTTVDLSNVTTLGTYAFYYCSSLATVTLSDELVEIPDYCFRCCSDLGTINSDTTGTANIPDSVESIGEYAFGALSSSNASACNAAMTTLVTGSNLISIGSYAFSYAKAISSVSFNDGLLTIGSYSFRGQSTTVSNTCTTLSIPSSVTSVGDFAFGWNNYLQYVIFEGNGTSVGNYAFCYDDDILTVITKDSGSTEDVTIGQYAFTYNSNSTFMSLTTVVLSENVTSIGRNAFYYDESLTTITTTSHRNTTISSDDTNYMPENLTYIAPYAFFYCNTLTGDMYFFDDLEDIGRNCFSYNALSCLYFGGGLTSSLATTTLEYDAFSYCTSLTSLYCYGVSYICSYAFEGCTALMYFYYNSQIKTIGFNSLSYGDYSTVICWDYSGNYNITSTIYFTAYQGTAITAIRASLSASYLESNYVLQRG